MQDAKDIEAQTLERIRAAEVRTASAENHGRAAAEKRAAVEPQIVKFRALAEMFAFGRQVLEQRKAGFADAQPPPSPAQVAGTDLAITELGALIEQVNGHAARQEGAHGALLEMEELFKNEALQARGMGRGAEVAGNRAAQLAARSGEIQAAPAAEPEEEGVGGLLDVLGAEGVEDEPIGAPQTTGQRAKRSARRKAE